jgi:hypothetical protein
MLSCNIIAYRKENLVTQLKAVTGYFDKIRLVNSNYEFDRIKNICSRFDVEYYQSDFENTVSQINCLLPMASAGEWFMYLSDDEIPSIPLLENIYNDIDKCIEEGSNCVFYPFINVREYTPTVDVVSKIGSVRAYHNRKIAEEFGIDVPYQWDVVRLFKAGDIYITGSAHDAVCGRVGDYRSIYPILHYKPFDGFVISALWQSVTDKSSTVDSKIIEEHKKALVDSGIQPNSSSITSHLKSGNISQSLKDWMWKYKDLDHSYVYPWFLVYYFEFHPEELPDGFWDSRLINLWKSHMLCNRSSVSVMESNLHIILKKEFLKRGILELKAEVSL